MRYGSVCSGIEAATAAWHPLGWSPAWFAEIEPFPSRVLAHHYGSGPAERLPEPGEEPARDEDAEGRPCRAWMEWSAAVARIKAHADIPARTGVPNLGDMTTIASRILAGEVERPDLLVGGTPCQSFSVAGLRKGLADARGNLALSFAELVDVIDPAFTVWENVPGVLSDKTNAFGCLLGALVGAGASLGPHRDLGWTDAGVVAGPRRVAAWRVLDAQFFGLAQRRRRVFVVVCPRDGADPAEILFERPRLRWDPPTRAEAGQGTASRAADGTGNGGLPEVAGSLGAKKDGGWRGDLDSSGAYIPTVSLCLNAKAGGGRLDGESDTLIPIGGCFDVAHSLRAEGFDASEDGTGRGVPLVPVEAFQCQGSNVGPMGTLRRGNGNSSGGVPFIAATVSLRGRDGGATAELGDDCANALRASQGGGDKPHVLAPTPILEPTGRAGKKASKKDGLGIGEPGDPMFTLKADKQNGVLAFDVNQITSKANRSNPQPGDPAPPPCSLRGADAHRTADRGFL